MTGRHRPERWRPAPGGDTGAPVPFETIAPGMPLPVWDVPVKDETVTRLQRAVGLPPDPAAAVSPALAGNLCIGLFFRILPRNILHTRQYIAVHGEAGAGDVLTCQAAVVAVGARRGRAYVTLGASISTAGRPVWEAEAECMVPRVDATAVDMHPLERPPLAVPADAALVASTSTVLDLESMAAFSGRGSFHSDREIARRFGYDRPIAQGMHAAAYALPLLHLGPGREIELRFVAQTAEGDRLAVAVLEDGSVNWLEVARHRDGDAPVAVAVTGRLNHAGARRVPRTM